MSRLLLTGVVPQRSGNRPYRVAPESMIRVFGRAPVQGFWSGLYGLASKRDGLRQLLQTAQHPFAIFSVVCEVPGEIVTKISEKDLAELGYLNVRYADAALLAKVHGIWSELSGMDDGAEAIYRYPELAAQVAERIAGKKLSLIIHPFRARGSQLVLTVATVLKPHCIVEVHSREEHVSIALGPTQSRSAAHPKATA